MKTRDISILFSMGLLYNYLILVLDNLFFSLFEGSLLENFIWIFVTEFNNIFDPVTIILFSFFFAIPFVIKLKKKYLYIFSIIYVIVLLAFNKVLFFGIYSLLEEGLGYPDIFVVIAGIFLFIKLAQPKK